MRGLQKGNSCIIYTEISKGLRLRVAEFGGIAGLLLPQILACQRKSRQLDSDLCVLVYERLGTMKLTEELVTWIVQNHRVLRGA